MSQQSKQKCPVCGKKWDFAIKVINNKECLHDDDIIVGNLYFTNWEKKNIIEKARKERKVVVKGSDRILRIGKIISNKKQE